MKLKVPFAYTPKLTSEARFLMPSDLEPKLVDYVELDLSVLPEPPSITVKLERSAERTLIYRKDGDTWRRPLGLGRYGYTGRSRYTAEGLGHLVLHGYVPTSENDNLWGTSTLVPSPEITKAHNSELLINVIEAQHPGETFQKSDKRDCIDYESSKAATIKLWNSLNMAVCEGTGEIYYETSEPVIVLEKNLSKDSGFELVPVESRLAENSKAKHIFSFDDWSGAARLLQQNGCSLGYIQSPIEIEEHEVPAPSM